MLYQQINVKSRNAVCYFFIFFYLSTTRAYGKMIVIQFSKINLAVIPHFLLHYKIIKTKSSSRSSRPEVFYKEGVLRTFAKFLGKHPCQSLFLIKLQFFLWILWNFYEHLFSQNTSSGCFFSLSKQFPLLLYCFFWMQFFKLSKTFKTLLLWMWTYFVLRA